MPTSNMTQEMKIHAACDIISQLQQLSGQVNRRNDRQLCADTSELTMGIHTKFMSSMMILKAMPGHPTSPYKASMPQDARHNGQTWIKEMVVHIPARLCFFPHSPHLPRVTNRDFQDHVTLNHIASWLFSFESLVLLCLK